MSLQSAIDALASIPYYGAIPIPESASMIGESEEMTLSALSYLLNTQIHLQESWMYLVTKPLHPNKTKQEFK